MPSAGGMMPPPDHYYRAALQNAQSNSFIAQLPNNASAKMGLLHASYGTGAFIAPLIATQFSQLPRWSFHYLSSLSVAILNSSLLFFVFRLRRLHEVTGALEINASGSQSEGNKYKDIFGSQAVQFVALFIWVYVGTEVTIGGWIVTFIIEVRGGGASAGYITSGFFGGNLNRIGERRVIYVYCLLAIGLELIVWLVPDIIGNALAVSFVGLLLGPMYPIAMNITSNIVPRRILTGSIGWIASFGQAGSAVFPFITGVLAQKPRPPCQNVVYTLGHGFTDILKVDIENAEFDVFGETVRHHKERNLPPPFGRLQLEIHSENVPFEELLKWCEALRLQATTFHADQLDCCELVPHKTDIFQVFVPKHRDFTRNTRLAFEKMGSSTLTLPVDVLSSLPKIERRSSFSAARASTGIERPPSPTPRLQYRHDQEAIEMDTMGGGLDSKSISTAGAPEVPAWTMSPKEEWAAIATCCGCMFMSGWNDAATGPLLPTIQAHYNIGFIVVSMLFVSNCVGYLSAAVINIHLTDRLGLGKITLLGAALQILAYSILTPAPPFPILCISYALNGFGVALHNAQANGFIAELPKNTSAKLGLLHAGYGAGAFTAPFVATQFAQMPRWSFYYLISLGLSLVNSLAIFFVFKLRRQHEIMGLPAPQRNDENVYKAVFSSREAQLLAVFSWVYVGTEVTVGGWIVTFIIEERGGGTSAGYVSSGYFGGLMLGRVALLWVNKKIGERRVIYLYSVLAIGLELVIWLVPDIIGNAVAVSFVGLLLGPMFPIIMKVTSELVPKRILTGCIGCISSSGQVGSAVFPFMTGALAQKNGVKVLQPMLVGMIGALIVLWTLVPSVPQRHRD
ncbi:unnamed protein product [Rhizoctonia solani]|uniref:Major facilitator superfamily (MFS) profile domain-containing protein n=1 Tax=Rhizoctonia solani TaxID=456999 RepID=A0A8H2X8W9_9AGAM|nr:unnamed protein product [Rhizoctonia solani]